VGISVAYYVPHRRARLGAYISLMARRRDVFAEALDDGPADDRGEVERSWLAEISARVDAVEADEEKGVRWSKVKRAIETDLAKGRGRRRRPSVRAR
jgi:hypothetical protein